MKSQLYLSTAMAKVMPVWPDLSGAETVVSAAGGYSWMRKGLTCYPARNGISLTPRGYAVSQELNIYLSGCDVSFVADGKILHHCRV